MFLRLPIILLVFFYRCSNKIIEYKLFAYIRHKAILVFPVLNTICRLELITNLEGIYIDKDKIESY